MLGGTSESLGMEACVPSCLCHPRLAEPFTREEQEFLFVATAFAVSTKDFLGRMDSMEKRVGKDRLGYLLSVPVFYCGEPSFIVWPWIRVTLAWTRHPEVAHVFVNRMIECRACLEGIRVATREGGVCRKAWSPGMCHHPGSCSMRGALDGILVFCRDRPDCVQALQWERERRRGQGRRWDLRRARRVCIRVTQFAGHV